MDRFELLRTELTRRCPGLELREEAICEYGSFYQNGRWIKCGNCDGRNTL